MRKQILEFLNKTQGYASGEEISHRLGMSRQALWKHIQELKELGYEIVAVPHLGYQLVSCPDRLFTHEVLHQLNTKFIGKKIYYFDTVSSTMDIAFQLGLKNSPEGTLVLAEAQTKGRGRLGRGWFSPKYKGVYLSLLLRPRILPSQAPILTLFCAVSICEAIKENTQLDAQIKWPNDILLHNKKAGGILTEINAETDETRFVVIGIGLNVNNAPQGLIDGSTSLKEQAKVNINRVTLLQEVLRRLEANYLIFQKLGAQPIIEKWRAFNITLHRRVKVVSQRKHTEGLALDLDSDGALLLRKDSGVIVKITSADITHLR